MTTTPLSALRRFAAAVCVALLAVSGVAACEDTTGTGTEEENGGGY